MIVNEVFVNKDDSLQLNLICSICKANLCLTKFNKDIWYLSAQNLINNTVIRFCSKRCFEDRND